RFEEERRMPYVSSVERIAERKGLERGLEQGRQEGRQEGRREGLEQGRHEGALESLRQTLLQLGEQRFDRASSTVRRDLQRIASPERLERMVSCLLQVASWKELLEVP